MNPIERVWHYLKQHLSWEIYQDIEQLKEQVRSVIEGFSPEIIASLTGWDYILEALTTVHNFLEMGLVSVFTPSVVAVCLL